MDKDVYMMYKNCETIEDFIEKNLQDIYKDMTDNNSKAKKNNDNKRQELSECATKKLNQLNVKIKLSI